MAHQLKMVHRLTRDEILGADDRPTATVDVPEWKGFVRIRTISGQERDQWEKRYIETGERSAKLTDRGFDNLRASFVALCVCDDEGERIFSSDDVVALGAKSALALDRVYEVAQKLNGLTDDDVEELEKNSASGPSDDSVSGSPSDSD